MIPLPKQYKIDAIKAVKDRVMRSKSLVVTDYRGITVAQMTELRDKLRAEGVEYKVVKNRLAKIALRECGLDPMEEFLKGTKAVAFGIKDPVAPAKVLAAYAKDNDKLKIVGGQMDGQLLSTADIMELSKIPPREVLLARMLGSITSPVQKLAYGLHAVVAQIAYALDAVARKKGEVGETSEAAS